MNTMSIETLLLTTSEQEGTPCIPYLSWTTPLDSVLSISTSAVDTATPLYTSPSSPSPSSWPCHWQDCDQIFASLSQLSAHLDTEHVRRGQSSYTCEWIDCGREGRPFTKRHKLVSHLRTHTGDKPFVCQKCARSFSRRDSLVNHTRQHLRRASVATVVAEEAEEAEAEEEAAGGKTAMTLPPPRRESLMLPPPPRTDSLQPKSPPRRKDSLHVPLLVPAPIDTSLCRYVAMEEEDDDVDWNGLMYPLSPMTNVTDDTSNDGSTLVEFLSPTLTYFDAMDTETTWTSPEQFCLSVKQQHQPFHTYDDSMFDIYMQTD